jgi:hypothetical protein
MSADAHADSLLDELLALCLEAERLGVPLDREALFRRYPEHAAELADFLAGHDEFRRAASPLREARTGGAGTDGTSEETTAPTVVLSGTGRTLLGGLDGCLRLGKYRLIRELGRGGMGVVYEAWQEGVNRPVALKVISAGPFASEEELKRFRAEAEAAANLSHPGLVPIYGSMSATGGRSIRWSTSPAKAWRTSPPEARCRANEPHRSSRPSRTPSNTPISAASCTATSSRRTC